MKRRKLIIGGSAMASLFAAGTGGTLHMLNKLNGLADKQNDLSIIEQKQTSNLLFETFPSLAHSIPWIPLGDFPTPVMELGSKLGLLHERLWVKQDNLTSSHYGGNKVRKLEYLLADAMAKRCKSIITIGGIGSNHALATSIYGKMHGLNVHLCLFDQPFTCYVKNNLKGFLAADANLHYSATMKDAYLQARKLFNKLKKEGEKTYFMLSGGTCGLSNVGYVNAGLELAKQVKEGLLPEPDKIYIAAGTCGTIAGLIAGVKIAKLPSRVIGVRVVDSFPAYPYIIRYYAQKVVNQLRKYAPSIPRIKIREDDFDLLTSYLGDGYGVSTNKGENAVERTRPHLSLETTYTGKTMAACLDDIELSIENKKILFWNTYNSAAFSQSTSYEGLPEQIMQNVVR